MNQKGQGNNKVLTYIIIGVIAMAVIYFGFMKGGLGVKEENIPSGVTDNGVSLKVYSRGADGIIHELSTVLTEGKYLSTVTKGAGSPVAAQTQIQILHTISSPTGTDAVNVNVSDIDGSYTTKTSSAGNTRYNTALSACLGGTSGSFVLTPGGASQSCTSGWMNITDLESTCDTTPFCTFKLQTTASYKGVDPSTGQPVTTTIPAGSSYGTVVIKVTSDKCSDNTPYGQCSVTTVGKYCNAGTLLDCASPTGCTGNAGGCACNPNYVSVAGVCTEQLCVGGAHPGECTGTDAKRCNPSCTTASCTSAVDCTNCGKSGQNLGAPLGWTSSATNAVECALDYYGAQATGCTQATGICQYKTYTGGVSIILA